MATSADPPAETALKTSSSRRGADFFIVGHAKSGTTALYQMLRRQPQIFMPDLKETWFFSPELQSRFRPAKSPDRPDNLDEYLELFESAAAGQRTGEATPSYLWSQTAAARIAEVNPDARIIAILREPASFLRSLHLQLVQTHVETEMDLRKAIELEGARREGKEIPPYSPRPQALLYSDHVQYVEQLRRYHAVFPTEQVLVLIYEDFRRENEATVRTVLDFLDVQQAAPIEVVDANPTVRVRSQQLHELVRSMYLGRGPIARAAKGAVKALTPRSLRTRALHATQRRLVYGRPRDPDEQLMLELRRRFQPEVLALSEYLDRDLVRDWGYDSLG